MDILVEISENLQIGKARAVKELVQKAVDEGIDAKIILQEGLLNGMVIIGEKFRNDEVYVPDVLIASRAMNAGTEILKPLLASEGVKTAGKVVLGTVTGDLHDIGKNLVKIMMEGKGLEVIDLGVDVSADKFIEAVVNEGAQVIACSALLTTTMGEMENVVNAAKKAGIRDKVTILVGGAPITDSFASKIGADVYAPDATSAAEEAAKACC